jgi:hypothetical protein
MPAAKKPAVVRDIAFTLRKDAAPHKVVSVLQEQFKTPETVKDGKTVAARKLQGRLVIGAAIDAVFSYASPETLAALAADAKAKGGTDNKASEYISAIVGAREVAPSTAKPLTAVTDEELDAEIARRAAAKAAGAKTKNVAAV